MAKVQKIDLVGFLRDEDNVRIRVEIGLFQTWIMVPYDMFQEMVAHVVAGSPYEHPYHSVVYDVSQPVERL